MGIVSTVLSKLSYISDTKIAIRDAIRDKEVDVPSDATFFSYGDWIRRIRAYGKKEKQHSNNSSLSKGDNGGYASKSKSTKGKVDEVTGEEKNLGDLQAPANKVYLPSQFEFNGKKGEGFATVKVAVNEYPTEWTPYKVKFYANSSKNDESFIGEDNNVPPHGTAYCNGAIPEVEGKIFAGWEPSCSDVTEDMECVAQYVDFNGPVAEEIEDSWETIAANGGAPYPIGAFKVLDIMPFDSGFIAIDDYGVETAVNDLHNLGNSAYQGHENDPAFKVVMTKIASGEDGTASTWLAYTDPELTYPITINSGQYGEIITDHLTIYGHYCRKIKWKGGWRRESAPDSGLIENFSISPCNWNESMCREVLNSAVFNALPEAVKQAIVPVRKVTTMHHKYQTTANMKNEKSFIDANHEGRIWYKNGVTQDYLWIPSIRELYGPNLTRKGHLNGQEILAGYVYNGSEDKPFVESEGITYTAFNPWQFIGNIYHEIDFGRTKWKDVPQYNWDLNGASSAYARIFDEQHGDWGDNRYRLQYVVHFGFCLNPVKVSATKAEKTDYNEEAILAELDELGKNGNVDLKRKVVVPGSEMGNTWNVSDNYCTVFSSTYSNSDGKWFNFTPIKNDGVVLSRPALDAYAEAVLNNEQSDDRGLQMGGAFDSQGEAETAANRIHELHEILLEHGYYGAYN